MIKLNEFQIKLFMVLVMVLDHIEYFVPPESSSIFHAISRCVGVWFAYCAVEGFIHTRSRKKYLLRLFSWAGVMYLGNKMIAILYSSKDIQVHNNIFLTMACGVTILCILDLLKNRNKFQNILGYLGTCIIIAFSFVFTEGGIVIIPFMIITYFLRSKPKVRNIIYCVFSVILFYMSFVPYDTFRETIEMLGMNSDFLFITVIPFIHMYNGERGNNSKVAKYFFYIFYPLHLWIIATITYFM